MGWLLCVLLLSTPAHAKTKWDWSQNVGFQEDHDPAMIVLTDGRQLKVHYTTILWETVHGWAKERPLQLAYKPETGLVLIDVESGKALPVLRGLEKHPIELLTEKCLQENPSTVGMIGCYGKARDRWGQEMDRAYNALLATLNDPQSQAVRQSQQQWLRFKDSQITAIFSVNSRQGTVWSIISTQQVTQLVKEQAERLNSQLDPI
jgi:uncharacterized protein YecT (DUF1311 family)